MNIYKNLLFLHGHFADPHMDDGYGPSYGNRKANARTLRENWQTPGEALAQAQAAEAGDQETCGARAAGT